MATITERPLSTTPERKGINKKLAATLLAGSIAIGGGIAVFQATQNKDNSPQATPFAGNISNEGTFPIPSDVEVGNNNEQEQTLENFAISTWLDILSSSQKNEEGDGYFNLTVTNLNDWEHNASKLAAGEKISETLKISWQGGLISSYADSNENFLGHKVLGAAELENIVIESATSTLTESEIANGYEFKGGFKIKYAERFYNYFFEPDTQAGDPNKENVIEWTKKPEEVDPKFSEWTDGSFYLPVSQKNGVWSADLDTIKRENLDYPKDKYNGFLVPVDLFYTDGCGEGQDCQIITKNPPYN